MRGVLSALTGEVPGVMFLMEALSSHEDVPGMVTGKVGVLVVLSVIAGFIITVGDPVVDAVVAEAVVIVLAVALTLLKKSLRSLILSSISSHFFFKFWFLDSKLPATFSW